MESIGFSNVVGLSETKSVLLRSVKEKHVAHAQLFVGMEGSGALLMALSYAKYIHCEQPGTEDACGSCFSCSQFDKLTHPDLHFYFPTTTQEKSESKHNPLPLFRNFCHTQVHGNISAWSELLESENKQLIINVEHARQIVREVAIKPFYAGFKTILIWLPEYMNIGAANALLKILEEPPANTVFLLVSQEKEKLLSTIISRCQLIYIPPYTDEDIQYALVHRYRAEQSKAETISILAEGNMYKALDLLKHTSDEGLQGFVQWLEQCSLGVPQLVAWADHSSKWGREGLKHFLIMSLQMVRYMTLLQTESSLVKLRKSDKEILVKSTGFFGLPQLYRLQLLLNEAYTHIERNGNAKIILCDVSLKIRELMLSAAQ